MHGFIREIIIGARQQERQCTLYKDQCRRASNEDESHAMIHLAVGINEYSPWRWLASQAGCIPSIDINRRLIDQRWALDVNALACHV
jgi:hypothetical protein